MNIEKAVTIGQLLREHPELAQPLLDAGMHCLGCPASQMETLEQACSVHGIDCDALVEKLKAALN